MGAMRQAMQAKQWSRLGLLLGVACSAFSGAEAQNKGINDASAKILMDNVWDAMPPQYTRRSSEVIVVDKTKKSEVVVPLEKGKEVIFAGYRSARAEYCGLLEEYAANFNTMMKRELVSSQWTAQQLLYIELLHNYVMQYSLGKMRITLGEDGKKRSEVIEKQPLWTKPCTETDRQAIGAQIMSFVKADPAPSPPAAPTEQPRPASQKK
jgi:hypothetical protein